MNEEKISDKKMLSKRLVFTVSVALIAVVISVAVSSFNGSNGLKDKLPETSTEKESVTQLAQAEKEDVPDERESEQSSEKEISKQETETETKAAAEKESQKLTEPEQTAVVNAEFVLPFDSDITKKYSKKQVQYSKTMNDWRIHSGVDFAGKEGDNVYSVGNGTVSKIYVDSKWGYVIEVDYGTFTGRYCGISQENAVSINQSVSTGDVIGTLTSIPIESADGVHLHFEALKDGENIDPFEALRKK